MKFKKLFFIFALVFILNPLVVFAESFKSINIEADIDKNGVGHINETWQIEEDNDDYTERYKLINNLKGIKIENFSVNALGRDFTELMPWDIDASFEDKKYRYGRIDRDDEVELTWGISEFGDNTYNLKYEINPLVVGLNDSDMLFFKFVGDNFDPKPEKVSIKIKGFEPFQDVKMWGFGHEGEIKNVNGEIILNSTGEVNYSTIMLKFPKGYFNTTYKIDKNFSDYANEAVKGSSWEENEGNAYELPMSTFAKTMLGLVIAGVVVVMFFSAKYVSLHFDENNIENKKDLPKMRHLKGEYYKDVPYDGPIEDLAFFIKEAGIVYNDLAGNYINSFILKWFLYESIEFTEDEKLFSKNKIKILSRPENMGPLEEELFDMISAANEENDKNNDGYLSSKEFKKYVEKNKEDMENYYDKFEEISVAALKKGGYLEDYTYEKEFLNNRKTGTELRVTKKGKRLYENIIKFKNFIDDYYDIIEEGVEFNKWREFLIYSSVFFLDKDFAEGAKYYPNYINNYHIFNSYISDSRDFSKSINTAYGTATGFSNAGYGGSTSAGGGGGSFGGGGGGGR